MKGKHLAILLVLVVVIGGASWFLQKSNRSSWSDTATGAGGKVVNLPLNDVARITVKATDGELNLVKKGNAWTVGERADYPADFVKVSELLRKVWDLKTVQDVKVGPSQLARLELIEPGKGASSGTLVDFKDKDGKRLEALLLGKKHVRKSDGPAGPMGDMGGFPVGRYVMPMADKAKVSLVSDAFEEIATKAENWLNRDFIKIENPKAITLAGTTDAQKWKITRENPSADWKLADAKPEEQLDSSKVASFGSLLANASFTDVLAPDAKPADTGLDKPTVATFETTDGFTYTLKIGKASGDNFPVLVEVNGAFAKERTPGKDEKPEDKTKLDDEFKAKLKKLEEKLATEKKFEGRPYLIAKFTVEALIKDRATLLAEKKAEPTPAPAAGAAPAPGGSPLPTTPAPPAAPAPAPAPGASAPSPAPKIEAVTPPVSIPPKTDEKPAAPAPAAPASAAPAAPSPSAPAEKAKP